ncbi:MAG: hypothetical protein LBC02_00005 [Planctomycetaceae bacterium]|jgi:hypothetical protein|nr:hypothetical protein [Planctomycetaceae bacterium]
MPDLNEIQKALLQNGGNFQKVSDGLFSFVEKFDDDAGITRRIRINIKIVPESWYIEQFDKKNRNLKCVLKKQCCSDTVIWQWYQNHWQLYILEIKQSVGRDEWEKIKNQFLGSYRLCRMLAAVLDIEFETVQFYTVFVNDKINTDKINTNSNTDESDNTDFLEPELNIPNNTLLPKTELNSPQIRFNNYGWEQNYTDREYRHTRLPIDATLNNGILEGTFVLALETE